MKNLKSYIGIGTVWVDKFLGTFHVVCFKENGKVFATGNVVRPIKNFKKNYIALKNMRNLVPVKI